MQNIPPAFVILLITGLGEVVVDVVVVVAVVSGASVDILAVSIKIMILEYTRFKRSEMLAIFE